MNFICPSPLAYAYTDQDTTIWALEIGNCAVPCPSVQITEKEYQLQADVFTYVVLITTLITVVILFKMAQRFFIRTMFIVGFFLFATVALIFVYLDRNNDIVCSGKGHYVKRDPLCVFQAAVFVFSIIWVQCWSVILAFDAYMHIVNKLSPQYIEWRRRVYFCVSFFTSLICTLIPLAANNLGFDPYANIPFCLYLFSEHKEYFWGTLFVPFVSLNLACSLITIAGAVKIQMVFVLSKSIQSLVNAGQDDNERSSSTEEFISGHVGDDLSSFGGSINNTSSRHEDIVSAIYSSQVEGMTESSMHSETDAVGLAHPLLDPFDTSYILAEMAQRESIGAYAYNRSTTPLDPDCVTNVTDELRVAGSQESTRPSDNLDAIARGTSLREGASPYISTSSESSKRSLKWLRFWSQNSGELTEEAKSKERKLSHWEYLVRKTVKYNGRTMLFLVMFCLTTLFVAPILIYLQYVKYDDYMDSGDAFVECLIKASFQCEDQTQSAVDEYSKEQCGEHPKDRANVIEVIIPI